MPRPRKPTSELLIDLSVKMSPQLMELLDQIALGEDRSRAQIARYLIIRGLVAYERDGLLKDDVQPAALAENANAEPVNLRPAVVPGFVYVLRAGDLPFFKIGRAVRISNRLAAISPALPYPVTVEHTIEADDYVAAETHLHRLFAHRRTNGEWFALSEPELAWLRGLTALTAPYPVLAGVEELERMMEGA